jgi:serine/threonine protein kinase
VPALVPSVSAPVATVVLSEDQPASWSGKPKWTRLLIGAGKIALKLGASACGAGVAVDVADMLWDFWGKVVPTEEERRQVIQQIALTPPEEFTAEVDAVVDELSADAAEDSLELVKTYLHQIPKSIQRSLRTQADPTGKTVPPSLSLRSASDLAALLPRRLPRFAPGDRPPGVGDWELVELLGAGGFGEVWKARNPNLAAGEPVALKFCLDLEAAASLRNEAVLLNHVMEHGRRQPGIVALLHTYLSADPPCLEYQYVAGGDLTGFIRELHQPPAGLGPRLVEQAANLMRDLAGIIGFAHGLHPPIVHRDLKPANVLVQRSPRGKITIRVSDFGIGAVAAGQALTQTAKGCTTDGQSSPDVISGAYTPLYASPQQVRGERPDPTDDVYSLGIVWHQLLIGELTKGCPTGKRWRQRLLDGGMPAAMADLLESCFEAEATDRPANAGVLADRLTALLKPAATPAPATKDQAGPCVTFTGHKHWVNSAVPSRDGGRVLTGSSDKTVRLWDVATQAELACCKGHSKTVRSVALSADGRLGLSGAYDGTVRVWDLATGRELFCFVGHQSDVMSVAFAPDGHRALSVGKDGAICLWDVQTGEPVAGFACGAGEVWSAAFTPDGRRILSTTGGTEVAMWDAESGGLARVFEGHTARVWCVALSRDGQFALSAGSDKKVHLWGVESGQEVGRFAGHKASIWGVDFSPDGRLAASCGYDKTVRIWDVASGKEVACLTGHGHYVMSVAFTPDGRRVLTGSRDKTVRLWEVPA